MGAFSKIPTVSVPRNDEEKEKLGWEPHETVTIKAKAQFGDVQYAADPKSPTGVDMVKLLSRLILSWTLTDDNHNAVPVTEAAIEQLPITYVVGLTAAIQETSLGGLLPNPSPSVNSVNGRS